MKNQHKKSNQLSLLNIIVIVCYLCLLVGTPISVLNFWTITRIVPTDYTVVSVQTMIAITVYGISGIIAFVASIMISVRLIRHYTGSKHTLGIVIIAGLVTNILCSLVQGIYPIVAEADVQTVKTIHSVCTVISTAIFAVTVYYLHTIVKETEAAKLSTGTEETGETA